MPRTITDFKEGDIVRPLVEYSYEGGFDLDATYKVLEFDYDDGSLSVERVGADYTTNFKWLYAYHAEFAGEDRFAYGDQVERKGGIGLVYIVQHQIDDRVWVQYPEDGDDPAQDVFIQADRLILHVERPVEWEVGKEYTRNDYSSSIKFVVKYVNEDGGAYIKYTHTPTNEYGVRDKVERPAHKETTA